MDFANLAIYGLVFVWKTTAYWHRKLKAINCLLKFGRFKLLLYLYPLVGTTSEN